jgi:hypothetical protein
MDLSKVSNDELEKEIKKRQDIENNNIDARYNIKLIALTKDFESIAEILRIDPDLNDYNIDNLNRGKLSFERINSNILLGLLFKRMTCDIINDREREKKFK